MLVGKGTACEPYVIATAEQFIEMSVIASEPWAHEDYFLLVADIDLKGAYLGRDFVRAKLFGQGHTVSNIKIDPRIGGGIFGHVRNCLIRDITFKNISVDHFSGGSTAQNYFAGILFREHNTRSSVKVENVTLERVTSSSTTKKDGEALVMGAFGAIEDPSGFSDTPSARNLVQYCTVKKWTHTINGYGRQDRVCGLSSANSGIDCTYNRVIDFTVTDNSLGATTYGMGLALSSNAVQNMTYNQTNTDAEYFKVACVAGSACYGTGTFNISGKEGDVRDLDSSSAGYSYTMLNVNFNYPDFCGNVYIGLRGDGYNNPDFILPRYPALDAITGLNRDYRRCLNLRLEALYSIGELSTSSPYVRWTPENMAYYGFKAGIYPPQLDFRNGWDDSGVMKQPPCIFETVKMKSMPWPIPFQRMRGAIT